MASSSTNKQPLLIDRVLHTVLSLDGALVNDISFNGANSAVMVVNGIGTDGCLIEDIYSIATGTNEVTINLYFSRSQDYLRPTEGVFIGQFKSSTTKGARTEFTEMPKVLAPMPHAGTEPQFRALYVPKGMALWAAMEGTTMPLTAPILGVQGGWY